METHTKNRVNQAQIEAGIARAKAEYHDLPREAHLRFGLFLDGKPFGTFAHLKASFELEPYGFVMSTGEFIGGLLCNGYELPDPLRGGMWSCGPRGT
jgi:hypothetical protein